MLNSCDHLLQIELGLVGITFIYLLHNVQLLLCISCTHFAYPHRVMK